jgi:hypothetical protein
MCITARPVYDAILAIQGPEGFLFNYADDVYLDGVLVDVALAPAAAPGLIWDDRSFDWLGPKEDGT